MKMRIETGSVIRSWCATAPRFALHRSGRRWFLGALAVLMSAPMAATTKGVHLDMVYVRDTGEARQAFAEFEKRRPDGQIATGSGTTWVFRDTIRAEVLRLRLPMIARPEAGGTVHYAESINASMHDAADFVDRILKSATAHRALAILPAALR